MPGRIGAHFAEMAKKLSAGVASLMPEAALLCWSLIAQRVFGGVRLEAAPAWPGAYNSRTCLPAMANNHCMARLRAGGGQLFTRGGAL